MPEKTLIKTIKYALTALIALAFITVIVLCFTGKQEGTSFHFERMMRAQSELSKWIYEGKSITMPYTVKDKTVNEPVRISMTLPANLPDHYSIMYNSSYFASRVYVNGKKISEYGFEGNTGINTLADNVRVIVDLPDGSAGKLVVIEFTAVYAGRKIVLPRIYCDDRHGLQLFIISNNFFDLVFCILFLITCLIMVVIGVSRYKKFKDSKRLTIFLSFACFVLLIAAWMFYNSDLPQLFADNNTLINIMRHVLLACIGIPYMNVCILSFHDGKHVLRVVQLGNILAAFLIIILYLLRIAEPPETVWITHGVYIVVGISSLYFATREWVKYKESRMLLHGMATFIVAVIVSMYLYYNYPTEKYSSIVSGIGMLIYIDSLFMLILKQELKLFEEHMAVDIYKDMAFTDKLTGCGNRAGLERLMEGFSDGEAVIFIMADVNRLKTINDKFGHDAGDALILGAAKCLQGAVSDLQLTEHAGVFRLGGDEFVVIIWGKAYVVGNYYEALANRITAYNADHEHKLSIAKGYAEEKWNRATSGFADLYRIADIMMYADKELAHSMEAQES